MRNWGCLMSDPFLNFLLTRDPKKVKKEAGMVRRLADTSRAEKLARKNMVLESELADLRVELEAAEVGLRKALKKVKELEVARQFLLEENKKLRGYPQRKAA